MSVYPSLAALYIKSFYNLAGKKAPGEKRDPKALARVAGFIALAVLLVGNFGYLFVMINLGMYRGLSTIGLQGYLILNACVMATALTLVIGFMTALSTYYLNDMELQLLAMPIPPRPLFLAKFTAVYISEAGFSLFFMAATMVIFGIKEAPHPLFYLWGLAAALALPLPALSASYLIQIPLMTFARFLKSRKAIMIIGGVLGLVFALGFNVYIQGMMMRFDDPTALARTIANPDSALARMGRAYPPALFAWKAMAAPATGGALLSILAMLAICAACPALVALALGGTYAKSLVGFNETRLKKLSKAGSDLLISKAIRKGSAFRSLVMREINTMNREPLYLLNGPFIVVLMPIIVAVMLLVQKDVLLSDPDLAGVRALIDGGFGAAVAGLAGAFLGSGTSIACTSVSRDAKALPFIKSLPVDASAYFLAKLAHAMVFGAFGTVVGVGLISAALRLSVADALAGAVVSFALSSLLNMAGLWLDMANPRLTWDNPIAAMKQNPNSVIAILGAMAIMGGTGYLAFRFSMGPGAIALWFGAVPAAVFAALLAALPKYARKRLAAMEG